jgi:hypothetical protein
MKHPNDKYCIIWSSPELGDQSRYKAVTKLTQYWLSCGLLLALLLSSCDILGKFLSLFV